MSSRALLLVMVAIAVLAVVGWFAFQAGSGAMNHETTDVRPGAVPTVAGAPLAAVVVKTAPPTPSTVGVSPSIRADANANVASVVEASRTGKSPERLSALSVPKPFDSAAFATNPQAYLDIVEPGRVFQSAAPGVNVPVLSPKGPISFTIVTGGTCTLTAIAAPKAPVTFTTLDLGTFPNGLTTITVQANDQGEASAVYAASGGVIAGVRVLAGSPMASGQITFRVLVNQSSAAIKP